MQQRESLFKKIGKGATNEKDARNGKWGAGLRTGEETMEDTGEKPVRKRITLEREFWRDTLWFLGFLFLFYIIYLIIEYHTNIVEGFNRGWNSR